MYTSNDLQSRKAENSKHRYRQEQTKIRNMVTVNKKCNMDKWKSKYPESLVEHETEYTNQSPR